MALGTTVLSVLTVFGDAVLLLFLLDSLATTAGFKRGTNAVWRWFGRHALWFGLVVSLAAMLGSLYFSDYLGYAPCKLCWYQRIFMYPQPFLFALALWRREPFKIWAYSSLLSVIGGAIALFHYYIQVVDKPLITIPCSAVGYSASCTETFAMTWGYITIPFMALTAFVLLLVLGRLSARTRT